MLGTMYLHLQDDAGSAGLATPDLTVTTAEASIQCATTGAGPGLLNPGGGGGGGGGTGRSR